MSVLHFIGGPLVGALIGYCTNYIAVKMLFRPLKEVKIAGIRLPFTPGIIPKRKNDLAKTVGKAVGETLLTKEDLKSVLLTEQMETSVARLCLEQLEETFQREETLETFLQSAVKKETYEKTREQVKEAVGRKIMEGLQNMQMGEIIASEGKKAVLEKIKGTMLAMFVKEDLVSSVTKEIGGYVETYIRENGAPYIEEQVEREVSQLEQTSVKQTKTWIPVTKEELEQKIRRAYRTGAEKFSGQLLAQFPISQMVEDKIREMDVRELEALVLSVMRHELRMIVNLGALIGFLLGILNLLF